MAEEGPSGCARGLGLSRSSPPPPSGADLLEAGDEDGLDAGDVEVAALELGLEVDDAELRDLLALGGGGGGGGGGRAGQGGGGRGGPERRGGHFATGCSRSRTMRRRYAHWRPTGTRMQAAQALWGERR